MAGLDGSVAGAGVPPDGMASAAGTDVVALVGASDVSVTNLETVIGSASTDVLSLLGTTGSTPLSVSGIETVVGATGT
ncbi:MAG TPA: hypothetical protein PKH18_07080, partial [Ottowia sp.]|nr:hypothetical protein [Ottowia sp.]